MTPKLQTQLAKFESAFNNFLYSYLIRRDFSAYEEMFVEESCGFGTGIDEVFSNKTENLELTKRDLDSVPNPVKYTIQHKVIKLIDQHNAIVAAILDLETEIMGQKVKFNNFRMLITLHEKEDTIKFAGLHFSFPTDVHGEGEAYPLKELEDRAHVLSRMVEEKTKSLQEAYKELETIIDTDNVSGLFSRYYFEKSINAEWERFNRFSRSYSLVMMDIDQFKHINDTYGHIVGDEVLLIIGKVIQQQLRPSDVAARWGGDEFILLLPETSSDGALRVAQRINNQLARQDWPTKKPIVVSFGISSINPGELPEDVFQRTDSALYQAKHNKWDKIIVQS